MNRLYTIIYKCNGQTFRTVFTAPDETAARERFAYDHPELEILECFTDEI